MEHDDIDIVRILGTIFVIGLAIGVIVLGWVYLLGPLFNQADYQQFNTSSQHLQAVAQRFSDDCQQLATTTEPVAKKAIEQDIYQNAATIDLNQVQMPDTTRSCVNSAVYDATHQKGH